jgi:hypothetical protein
MFLGGIAPTLLCVCVFEETLTNGCQWCPEGADFHISALFSHPYKCGVKKEHSAVFSLWFRQSQSVHLISNFPDYIIYSLNSWVGYIRTFMVH